MSESLPNQAWPHRLLLATDLSSRCDRALDRAAQLAAEWSATLTAVNVLDAATTPDQLLAWASAANDDECLRLARRQLSRDLAGRECDTDMRIVRSTDTAGTIRNIAETTPCDLVITGVARNELFGRFLLGSTGERLAHTLSQPLLVVRNRAAGPYRRIVIASDFSAASQRVVTTALRLFPDRPLTVYHACAPLQAGFDSPPSGASMPRTVPESALAEWGRFREACRVPPGSALQPVIECGALETALTAFVRQQEIELVIIGTQARGGVMNLLIGSSAAKLLDWLPCDVLTVRTGAPATDA